MAFNSVNLPIEVVRDRRLTLEQHRVLMALFAFKSKDTDTVFPRRQKIAELTGMHLANISTATSALERLGWLTKEGKGDRAAQIEKGSIASLINDCRLGAIRAMQEAKPELAAAFIHLGAELMATSGEEFVINVDIVPHSKAIPMIASLV